MSLKIADIDLTCRVAVEWGQCQEEVEILEVPHPGVSRGYIQLTVGPCRCVQQDTRDHRGP